MKILFHQMPSQIQKDILKEDLNKLLIILVIFILLFGSYIANYKTTEDEAWDMYLNILRFNYLLIIVALREGVKKLIKPLGYKVVVYLLINHFIDNYFGIKGWSWNDTLTVVCILIESLIKLINWKHTINKLMKLLKNDIN